MVNVDLTFHHITRADTRRHKLTWINRDTSMCCMLKNQTR